MLLNRLVFGCYLAERGSGGACRSRTAGPGIIVHDKAVIGDDVRIGAHVVIGGRSKMKDVPVIGDRVVIAAGAKVLGPIRIGDESVIGANAVVIADVEAQQSSPEFRRAWSSATSISVATTTVCRRRIRNAPPPAQSQLRSTEKVRSQSTFSPDSPQANHDGVQRSSAANREKVLWLRTAFPRGARLRNAELVAEGHVPRTSSTAAAALRRRGR